MRHTPGPWIDSPHASDAIVSKHPDAMAEEGPSSIAYYGGYLICESVSPRDKPMIKAAERMHFALTAWQVLAEDSLSFRLALTNLGDNIGVDLLKLTQEALALADGQMPKGEGE